MLETVLGVHCDDETPTIACYWMGSEFRIDEGWTSYRGHWSGWETFAGHPKIQRALSPYHFGDACAPATHWLLLERRERELYIGHTAAVRRVLRVLSPQPADPFHTPEEMEADLASAARALPAQLRAQAHRMTRQDWQAIADAQHRSEASLTAWLDMTAH